MSPAEEFVDFLKLVIEEFDPMADLDIAQSGSDFFLVVEPHNIHVQVTNL